MIIIKYTPSSKKIWDDFVKSARNGHFIFLRDFMEYHSHKFDDCSLLVLNDKNNLIALLPANINNSTLYSHQGLTFGGFLIGDKVKTETMLSIFEELILYLKENGISKIIYKSIPHIYHTTPCEEDRYALFRVNAKRIRCDVSTAISLQEPFKFRRVRKRAIKKAKDSGVVVVESKNFKAYWKILNEVLENKYSVSPVHSLDEIEKLATQFPENMRLFLGMHNKSVVAGSLVFENRQIVHTQYSTNSLEGQKIGALDLILDTLINEVYREKKFFDFGTSNGDGGNYLNSSLISQKEGFGGRAIVHEFYEIKI
jgi:hypothetical protein